jgi:hypothetical protein
MIYEKYYYRSEVRKFFLQLNSYGTDADIASHKGLLQWGSTTPEKDEHALVTKRMVY